VLSRPDRGNPIDGRFCEQFAGCMSVISERADVRCLLITARGKLFSVGGDLNAMAGDLDRLGLTVKLWTTSFHSGIARLLRLHAPVVSAVHGNVAGGSVSLVAASDIVVVGKSVRLTSAFTKIGFSPDSGSTNTLTRRMGAARAKRFFLLGETLSAAQAEAMGLVDVVTEEEAVFPRAMEIARSLASGPTNAYAGIKRLFLNAPIQSPESQMEDEAQTLAAIAASADALEGIKAFQEKRSPNFHGAK